MVGLVVTTIADPFLGEVVDGIEKRALKQDFSVLLSNCRSDPQQELATIRLFKERRYVRNPLADLAPQLQPTVVGNVGGEQNAQVELVPHGQRIRLHGIDAPESRQLCRLDGKPWQCGKDAADVLADKIAHRSVTCEDLGRDRYKRIIARCTVAGDDLGEWTVANGWAVAYYLYSYEYSRAEHRV